MKRITALFFVMLFMSGCMSDYITVSTKLMGRGKSGDVVTVLEDGVIDICSMSGIGELELTPASGEWPATIVLRLHLRGLESLRISNGKFTVVTSVSSSPPHKQLCEVFSDNGKRETIVTEDSDYWMQLRAVNKKESANLEIPLVDGYFEVILSKIIFDDNLETIFVQWIDFYR